MLDDLVAVCGVSCAQCEAYKATRSGAGIKLAIIAAEWTKGLKKKYTANDIICDGCRTQGRKSAYCSTCNILDCARSKGHATCAHCPDGPCMKIVAPPAREAILKLKEELKNR
jgi:hypothetical protein